MNGWGRICTAMLVLLPVCTLAAGPPGSARQRTWGEKEKDAFYEWLQEQPGETAAAEDGRPLQRGQRLEPQPRLPGLLPNRYFSARAAVYDMRGLVRGHSPERQEGEETAEGGQAPEEGDEVPATGEVDADLVGMEFQYGRPLRSWFRQLYDLGYYRGTAEWDVAEGPVSDFSLFRAGYHLELALMPPGFDQRRNLVVRGGLNLFYGRRDEGDLEGLRWRALDSVMLDQVTGWQSGISWSMGYERLLGGNFWRVHGTLDGFRSFHLMQDGREDWSTLGLAAGISRAF